MRPSALRWLLLLIGISAAGITCAEPGDPFVRPYALRVWETDEGLPHNSITALLQRRDGFLWVATQGGVVRFDGLQFTPLHSSLIADAKSATVRGVIEENEHALLLATDKSGLLRYQNGEVEVHPLTARMRDGQKIQALFHEDDDCFWVIFANREAWRWQDGAVVMFPPRADTVALSPLNWARDKAGAVYLARGAGLERYADGRLLPVDDRMDRSLAIAACREGGLWIATAQSLGRFDGEKWVKLVDPAPWLDSIGPNLLREDGDGALWLAIMGRGLLRWEAGRFRRVNSSHAKINDLLEDAEGNLWVGTAGGGLDRLQPARFALLADEPDWTTDVAGAVCEDADGSMWFGNRSGLWRFRNGAIEPMSDRAGWPKKVVPLCANGTGDVWLAHGPQVFHLQSDTSAPPEALMSSRASNIRALFVARDGALWIGREDDPLERYLDGRSELFGPAQGYTGIKAQAFGEDAAGNVWVGTEDGRAFERQGGHWKEYTTKDGLPGSGLRAIHGDRDGLLWIGTGGGGLVVRRDGKFFRVTEREGLPDDVISQVLEDDFGALWFGSRRGIFKVSKQDLIECATGRKPAVTPIHFGRADGLPGITAVGSYQPTAWKTRSGRLWFVTRKGLVTTDPAQHRSSRAGPRVHLERFEVEGETTTGAEISSAARRLEFRFTAPTFTAPEGVRFRYRLDGFDAGWSEPSSQRFATYAALSPGRYVFRVMACNSDLVWSPAEATLAFVVLPQWWETWWLRLAALGLGGAAVVGSVHFWSQRRLRARLERLEQQRRLEQERNRIARDLHDDLGASLAQVSMMAEELEEDVDDLATVKSHSAQLAGRVRAIARDLDATVWAVSPKNDQLSSLCDYLHRYALEYFQHSPIRCRVHAASDIPSLPLSPELRHHLFLVAKEIMANALKHSGAAQVELTMRTQNEAFVLTVADDGRGFSLESAGNSVRNGLANLQSRVTEIGGELELETSARGTRVTILLPIDRRGFDSLAPR